MAQLEITIENVSDWSSIRRTPEAEQKLIMSCSSLSLFALVSTCIYIWSLTHVYPFSTPPGMYFAKRYTSRFHSLSLSLSFYTLQIYISGVYFCKRSLYIWLLTMLFHYAPNEKFLLNSFSFFSSISLFLQAALATLNERSLRSRDVKKKKRRYILAARNHL